MAETPMVASYTRFRHVAIERAGSEPTDAELAAIEGLLGARLPTSFREFLRVANGGYIEYVIDVPFGRRRKEALSFSSTYSTADVNKLGTFVGELRAARERSRVPPGVLPFARDGGGSIVFLDMSASGNGRVVAFVEGLPKWAGLRTESAFVELASSFDEYVDKLRIDRDEALENLEDGVTKVAHIQATEEWLDIGMPRWREDSQLVRAVQEARARVSKG